ncbi:MAG TPA: GPR1/FUN34/YaaH family transporter [Mycobacterium sp.]|nr:GPR1/FUN34/YaaH family transporter [Mycobacterium sp.]
MTRPEQVSNSSMSDPGPAALIVLGFMLALIGIGFVFDPKAVVAADYAILIAGAAELLAGVLSFIKGLHYSGYAMTIFGLLLLGLFFLLTGGPVNAHMTHRLFDGHTVGWYVALMAVPLWFLVIPAALVREYLAVVALLVLSGQVLTLGLAELTGPPVLLKVSGWLALTGAALIWFGAVRDMLTNLAAAHAAAQPHASVPDYADQIARR